MRDRKITCFPPELESLLHGKKIKTKTTPKSLILVFDEAVLELELEGKIAAGKYKVEGYLSIHKR